MKKQLLATAILSALVLSAPVLAEDTTSTKSDSTYTPASNGGFESKNSIEHTDSNGTTTSRKSEEKVDVDSKGNKETKVDIKSTTDPKGLFNKSTTETENKAVEKAGVTDYKHKKTVNGTTVEETEDKKEQQ